MTTNFSFWLVPEKRDEEYLSVIIRSLCNKYQTTSFPPHITASGGVKGELSTVISIVEESVQGIKPFSVEVEKIDFTQKPKKTLFLQLKPNTHLKVINARLSTGLHNINDQEFNPHLSLIYKTDMKKEDKIREIKQLKIRRQILIDKVAIVQRSNPEGKIDNATWQILFEKQF